MTSTTNERSYFDLHITGLGYVNRIRQVQPKRGDAFMACDISALSGPTDDCEYRRFDCRVNGHEAEKLIRRLLATQDDRKAKNQPEPKILIGFKLGDLWTDTYTYSKGERAGQMGVSLKARLLFIDWIKVDGSMVYKHERAQGQEPTEEQTPATATSSAVDAGGSASAGEYVPAPQAQTEPVETATAC
ncbi:STY4534 family ICE replication protein [Carnimonas bestiolae]|uniref:STY4534 family ICE replication protein n=1 Tax=Carnimonas bestiolae TaxID=3402172 RepID=UPI003EDC6E38